MSNLIESSKITVIKDTDGKEQSELDKVFSNNDDYYQSDKGDSNKSKLASIYFKTNEPMYLDRFDYDMSACDYSTKITVSLYGYGSDDTFSSNNEILLATYSLDKPLDTIYTCNIDKANIKRSQYYRLDVTQGGKSTYGYKVYVRIKNIALYGSNSMPGYLIKDTKDNKYYTRKDNDIVMISKDKLTETNLMSDIDEMTKDNLELISNPYKVLRILIH